MLTIAKEKTNEASNEYNSIMQKFKLEKESLEQNLTAQIEKEKKLLRFPRLENMVNH